VAAASTRPASTRERRRAHGLRLAGLTLVAAIGVQLLAAVPADGVPPPPPHPSNSSVKAAQAKASAKAGQVGAITSKLSSAQAALQDLQDDVELKQENANKALVDLQTAQDAATKALGDAHAAQVSADASGAAVEQLRKRVDDFAAGSFAQGSALGSVSAYFGATSPKDLLERQELLNDISGSELDILDQTQEARVQQANADSLARAALLVAQQKEAVATEAKKAADTAIALAQAAAASQAAQTNRLQATQDSLQQQLTAAQATVAGLKSQQQQYRSWLAAKQAEEARAAAAAARASAASPAAHSSHRRGSHHTLSVSASGSVAVVIRRALSAVGTIYAWGGGTASGPSRGIRDGGVADEYGDYRKIGFDCSGLMVYSFAGAGVSLPHYSGYQYTSGQHVPLSEIEPGDMLFYSSNGSSSGIHHVTMYIGGGQMVEAYESGRPVRVTSVRYYNGLMPYATRML
jgi:cell wall-associated NlpC family hydrolase